MSKTSDTEILERISRNDSTAWEILYDEYSAVMMGAVTMMVKNKNKAEQLLTDIFLSLVYKNQLETDNQKLSLYLYIYSFKYTIEQLKCWGIKPCIENSHKHPPIVKMLCNKYNVEDSLIYQN